MGDYPSDEEYKEAALDFFKWFAGNSSEEERNYEGDALNYIVGKTDWKYKDKLSADTLVMILEELEYLEFTEVRDGKRYHIATKKGKKFLFTE